MGLKKIIAVIILIACFATGIRAQRIALQPLYTGKNIMAAVNVPNRLKSLQLTLPSYFHDTIYRMVTPVVKASCIPHGPFAFMLFEATRQDDETVKLNFETINEYTSNNFAIERVFATGTEQAEITQPADTCYQLFVQAKKVAGFAQAGMANARNKQAHTSTYKIADHNNYTGITFYRITEYEYDSSTAVTQIIAVAGKPLKEALMVYPNPVVNSASLSIFSKYAGNGTVQLLNINGNVLKQFSATLVKGVNYIPINIPGVAKGMYVIRVVRSQHPALQASLVKQ
jgi:hypothetical protein